MPNTTSEIPNVLTIAGSDSGGGAGIQADIKTFSALGAYGLSVITAVTAQNTLGVSAVETLSKKMVEKQLTAVFEDIDIAAVKIGMLGNAELIQTVAEQLIKYKPKWVVIDPVMIATSGDDLLDKSAIKTLTETLFPLATIITPNIYEANVLLGGSVVDHVSEKEGAVTEKIMIEAAQKLAEKYDCAVLLKGGHANEATDESNDLLYIKGHSGVDQANYHWFKGKRVNTQNTHGTGCTLSSAITFHLAIGSSLEDSVKLAKSYIQEAIERASELNVGKGNGPVKHNLND